MFYKYLCIINFKSEFIIISLHSGIRKKNFLSFFLRLKINFSFINENILKLQKKNLFDAKKL